MVRYVEYGLGIKCPNADYSKLSIRSNPDEFGLLSAASAATNADPAVANILAAAAAALPEVASDLDLTSTHLRRALGGLDTEKISEGHGAGRYDLPAYGPTPAQAHKRSEVAEDEVPYGSSFERFSEHKKAHRRGTTSKLAKGVQGRCLSTK